MSNPNDHRRRPGTALRLSWVLVFLLVSAWVPLGSAMAQPYVFEKFVGGNGAGPGKFGSYVADVAIDAQGRIIVLDTLFGTYEVCNDNGNCQEFGGYGNATGQFNNPYGVDVNSQGEIFIADTGNNRVQKCNYNGQCDVFVTDFDDEGITLIPYGVAVDSRNNVIISDNYRILVCPPAGGECFVFGGYGIDVGKFSSPQAVAVDAMDRIVVADSGNNRIQICSQQGDCRVLGENEVTAAGGQLYPAAIDVLSSGLIVITENRSNGLRLCTFRGTCRLVLTPDFLNPAPGLPSWPGGMDEDATGRLVVADAYGFNIYRLDVGISDGMSDAWIETGLGGQGLLIVVFEEIKIMFVAWFTYDTERPPNDVTAVLGEPGHRWVTAQGGYSGNTASLNISLTQGGVFDQPQPAPGDPEGIGNMTIVWHDCMHATMTYSMNKPPLQGSMELTRIVRDNQALCQELSGAY